MNCPVCSVDLVMADRAGVEIDYCPKCRGVWLDRGEIDKIIERSEAQAPSTRPSEIPGETFRSPRRDDDHDDDHRSRKDHDDDDYRGGNDPRRKKRGGFLSNLFELGGGD